MQFMLILHAFLITFFTCLPLWAAQPGFPIITSANYSSALLQKTPSVTPALLLNYPALPPLLKNLEATQIQDIIKFYQLYNNRTVWSENGQILKRFKPLFAMHYLKDHGVNKNYYAQKFPKSYSSSVTTPLLYDMQLTAFLLKMLDDIKGGIFRDEVRSKNIVIEYKAFYHINILHDMIKTIHPVTVLQNAFPKDVHYQSLMYALAKLNRIQKAGGWKKLAPVFVKYKQRHKNVVALKHRLQQSGDYQKADFSNFFDMALLKALHKFQKRNGLPVANRLNKQSLRALNISVEDRIRQVSLNLERARWLDWQNAEKELFVNIPDYTLDLYENSQKVHRMKVVIGRKDRQSPIFSDTMRYINFNPYWYVPRNLASKDLLPKFKADSGYASRKGYKVFFKGKQIDPRSVNWRQYSSRNFPYEVVQKPGRANSLGSVKFMFPNKFSVYLHDTPAKSLFKRRVRAKSSGCVRVSEPQWLARWLLTETHSRQKVSSYFRSGRNKRVNLKEAVPIHLTYFTTMIDKNGNIQYRNDIYGHDKTLSLLMRKKNIFLF